MITKTIQQKLIDTQYKAMNKLFDHNIEVMGEAFNAIHFSVERDRYDDVIASIVDSKPITAILDMPDDLPLERLRNQGGVAASSTRVYTFDILPIEMYAKFTDDVEKDDILLVTLYDEKQNKVPFILKVADSFGKFHRRMLWRKYNVAPYNGILPVEVQNEIESLYQSES